MVISVDGARSAPAGRRHRLLRRALLIAALATGGWLLSVLFATSASAAEEPSVTSENPAADQHVTDPARETAGDPAGEPAGAQGDAATEASTDLTDAFGTLSTTFTQTVHDMHHAVTALEYAVTGTAQHTVAQGEQVVHRLTSQSTTARSAPVATTPAAPKKAPHKLPVTPANPASVATAPEHSPEPAAPPSRSKHASTTAEHAGEHAGNHTPGEPAEPPAPAAPGATSASGAHDNAGGARGTHGVLSTSTQQLPPAGGYTTRSRAADATGRVNGLPATSPD